MLIEERVEIAIAERFNLSWTPDARRAVKHADLTMLATEKRDLLGRMGDEREWALLQNIEPLVQFVRPMWPEHAKRAFLDRARELGLA